jgi:hypothetical protein
MNINLHRKERIGKATLGELWVEGTLFRTHSLEDLERLVKIKKQTAIPVGRYRLKLSHSPSFKRVTLEVLDVPNFSGVRIHAGNTDSDTEGCPLVAWSRQGGKIINSRSCELALTALALQFKEAGEELWLNVTSDLQPVDAPQTPELPLLT